MMEDRWRTDGGGGVIVEQVNEAEVEAKSTREV